MISKISFKGNVYYASSAKDYGNCHKDNTEEIKKYADENNVDIFVLQSSYYMDGKPSYRTLISKENQFWFKTFDFEHDDKSNLVRCPSHFYSDLMKSGYRVSDEKSEFNI